MRCEPSWPWVLGTGWSIGSLDVNTAFLYAALHEEEDGILSVQPPSIVGKEGARNTWRYVETQEGALRPPVCAKEMDPET